MGIRRDFETKNSGVPGVFEETAPLKEVMMWGSPGTEAALGQLLPVEMSCFQTNFDVPGARSEFGKASQILEKEGVKVIYVKDLFAKMIKGQGVSPARNLQTLRHDISSRAIDYYKSYRDRVSSDIEEVLSWIDRIVDEDIDKYGEETAIVMNEVLTLNSRLPLSNVLYARDQSNLLGTTWIWSSMRHEIRQPEVNLFQKVLNYSDVIRPEINQIQVNGAGRFEGGDGIANSGIFYIGVGGRSNITGIIQAGEVILASGGRVIVAIDEERDAGGKREMDAMHLDTIWMPSGPNEVVACVDEVKRRKILEAEMTPGGVVLKEKGWFMDHLEERGIDLVPLTKDEQEKYAPNFLNLGNNKLVLSLADGNNLTTELGKRGKIVHNANLINITKGYGGLHCMTASIVRGK